MPFISPLYPVPLGVELGKVSTSRFSGIPTSGLLAGVTHSIFFSPSFISPISGNEIDVDYIEITARAADIYVAPVTENKRVFTWGPTTPPFATELSITNDSNRVSAPKVYTIVATMIQTIPPGPTQIFKIL